MTEYQRIFSVTFAINKRVRNTNGMIGRIIGLNPNKPCVQVIWDNGIKTFININEEHIYIVA